RGSAAVPIRSRSSSDPPEDTAAALPSQRRHTDLPARGSRLRRGRPGSVSDGGGRARTSVSGLPRGPPGTPGGVHGEAADGRRLLRLLRSGAALAVFLSRSGRDRPPERPIQMIDSCGEKLRSPLRTRSLSAPREVSAFKPSGLAQRTVAGPQTSG